MGRIGHLGELPQLQVDRTSGIPLSRQVERHLRDLITSGKLKAGSQLPSSRQIAKSLGCSRGIVVGAIEQLSAEGFLECSERSGTFVTHSLSDSLVARRAKSVSKPIASRKRNLSSLSEALLRGPHRIYSPGTAFSAGSPDIDSFPLDIWTRLFRTIWRRPPREAVFNQDPAGYFPLRRAIADYLRDIRGVNCDPRQVIITSGSQQAIDLSARLLLDQGDEVWVEEPGFLEAKCYLLATGATMIPVPVDDEGIQVKVGVEMARDARMAIVSPSHQYPLGMIMSYPRRLELLEWARSSGSWILEDDYDSEFRYSGSPLPALQAIDEHDSVLYTGSFAKVLFSSLRLGYLVLPQSVCEKFCRARHSLDPYTSMALQPVLHRFIEDGHFAAHIHRMRRQFSGRREALIHYGKRYSHGLLDFTGEKAGLHAIGTLASDLARRHSDRAISGVLLGRNIYTYPLSDFYLGKPTSSGLFMGYASIDEKKIADGMRCVGEVLSHMLNARGQPMPDPRRGQ